MTDTVSVNDQSLADMFLDASGGEQAVVTRAKAYLDARKIKEDAEQVLKNLSATLANAEAELLRAMDSAGVKSLKVEHAGGVNAISQTQSTYFSLPAGALEDKAIMDWINESGGCDIVKASIHHATFSSFCKELKEANVPLHAAVKIAERKGVQLRKG